MSTASIVVHTARYTVRREGRPDLVRPVEIAVVRRQRDGRTTRIHVIDRGDATRVLAHREAMSYAHGGAIRRTEVDHGDLGTFGATDEDRDAVLERIRALDIGIRGKITSQGDQTHFAGRHPLTFAC